MNVMNFVGWGSAGTEPLDFGVETLARETRIVDAVDEENVGTAVMSLIQSLTSYMYV